MFRYQALDTKGELVEGEMSMADEQQVVDALVEKHFIPVKVEAAVTRRRRPGLARFTARRFDRQTFFENLHDYLESGLSIDKALELESRSQQGPVSESLAAMLTRVRQGESLSEVMRSLPEYFSPMEAGIVKVGEESDSLDQSLALLARMNGDLQAFRDRVRSALAYPSILMLVMLLSMIILFTLVIPKFKPLFEGMGVEMQGMTRAVIGISDFLLQNATLLLALPLLLFLGWRLLRFSTTGRSRVAMLALDLPLLGPLMRHYNLYVFAMIMQVLMQRRIPMLRALEYLKGAGASPAYREAVDDMIERIRRGQSLGDVLPESLFADHFVHVVRVGEESGRLAESFRRLAAYHYKQLNDRIKLLMTYVEPMIIMLLGLMVGLVVVSMLQTLLGINELVA